jgi:predicted metal-dependent hydrolase
MPAQTGSAPLAAKPLAPALPPYTVRRSSRSRRVRIRVDPQRGVEVVLPPSAAGAAAAAAVAELRPWIERQLAAHAAARERLGRIEGSVPLLDERLALRPQAGRTRAVRRGASLLVPLSLDARGQAIERFFRRAARAEISRRLDEATAIAGLRYTRLAIRNQQTRWASCSSSGAMSFNWRLMLAPERVLNYVVWHEVCHLQIAAHTPAFWALLERRLPSWREPAQWLREHGRALVL